MFNKYIGLKDLDCVDFVVLVFPFLENMFKYANPEKKYNKEKAEEEFKNHIEKEVKNFDSCDKNEPYLLMFNTNNGISFHIGIYFNGYIYHVINNTVVADNIEKPRNAIYADIEIYKIKKEFLNDYSY
jgi:hypothetical protein